MTDLSKLRILPMARDREVDPIRIFELRTQRGTIEGLYGPQQEALIKWHSIRDKADILFSLPTGGGKTLVGLLAAQSMVNEMRGKVLYACATNQLVEQVKSQSEQCGIQVATYYDGKWNNEDLFQQGQAILVTNYHVLFNGRSKFLNETIKAVIFDDAHVAPNVIRDCFTLTLDSKHPAWPYLLQTIQPYFENTSFYPSFRKIQLPNQGFEPGLLFVPAWFIADNVKLICTALEDHSVFDELSTKFAYTHLRLHLAQCCFLLANNKIEIAPPVLPTHTLPYFAPEVRRLYMTATLPSRYECIRTFGVDRAEPIVPSGKAGAAQRLFVFARGKNDDELPYEEVRRLAAPRKACIIVPSGKAAKKWLDVAQLYDSKKGHGAITEFAQATDARKIVLAAIYDGIDLPGKCCKVLILDGVPRGAFLLDQFTEGALDINSLKASGIATRIVQSVGRIFRSNTDHGVVILADRFQQQWIIGPDHLQFMPPLLQQQVQLGLAIRKLVDQSQVSYEELMESVISGRHDWDGFYNSEMAKIQCEKKPKEPKWADGLALREYQAFRDLWEGRFRLAAEALIKMARDIEQNEKSFSAWFLHWAGLALKLEGDISTATQFFQHAACIKAVLGRIVSGTIYADAERSPEPGPQSIRLAKNHNPNELSSKLDIIQKQLDGDGGLNADLHEQAIKNLGEFLGFIATRPDKEKGTGPDVLWTLPELSAVVSFEAKSKKQSPKAYKKKVISKLHDDCIWLDKNISQATDRRVSIIGPLVPVVKQANPQAFYRVTPLQEFQDLAVRVVFAMQTIAAAAPKNADLANEIERTFRFSGLVWPECIDGLGYRFAVDLQDEINDEDVSD